MSIIGPSTIHGPSWSTDVPSLVCGCGSPDIIAVAPGTEPATACDLFVVQRGQGSRAWCAACWPWRAAERAA